VKQDWKERNRKWIFVVAPPAAIVIIGLCGELVKGLWNWLVPSILGLKPIDLWQALGLLLLSRILFGSWGGGGDRHHGHGRFGCGPRAAMTGEERERFRRGWGRHCAPENDSDQPQPGDFQPGQPPANPA